MKRSQVREIRAWRNFDEYRDHGGDLLTYTTNDAYWLHAALELHLQSITKVYEPGCARSGAIHRRNWLLQTKA